MRKLTALLMAMLCSCMAFAETFIVTTNADIGTGSLREAITKANGNGSAMMDYIHFQLPDHSIEQRTIVLLSELPELTSSIVIDGSTQPSPRIGVSDARIRISAVEGRGLVYVFRIIEKKQVGIYGIHFHKIGTHISTVLSSHAIQVAKSNDIAIGAAGKGNYFTNLGTAVYGMYLTIGRGIVSGLSFKSNIVNLNEEGTDLTQFSHATALYLTNAHNLEIGGELPEEGNYMSGLTEHLVYIFTDTLAHINLGYTKILNNKLGCNYLQTKGLKAGNISLRNPGSYGYTDTSTILVKGNSYNSLAVVGSNNLQQFLIISGKKGFIDIKSNKIGLLGSANSFFGTNIVSGISLGGCENGIIGGDDPADVNYLAGSYYNAISLYNNKAIKVTKNSIFCNSTGIEAQSDQIDIPLTRIFTITDYTVSGTSLPNSNIEVFLTKACTGCFNGKTYLGNTNSDASGNWTFTSSTLLDGAVTATGTSPKGATGTFAKPEYSIIGYEYRNPTCNKDNGYIKGIKFIAGTRYYWVRSWMGVQDTIYAENVENAAKGYYSFVVEQGKYCHVKFELTLNDVSPFINKLYRQITQPTCGQNNGSISNIYVGGSYNKLFWKNSAGLIVGKETALRNVPPGQYKLVVLDTVYNCGDSTEYFSLVNQAGPSLNMDGINITTATCSKANGSITGISSLNTTGTVHIRWVDSLNRIISNNLDLLNAKPGRYRLLLRDGANCDTIRSDWYIIPTEGDVAIDMKTLQVSASECRSASGAIRGITISGSNDFHWTRLSDNKIIGKEPDIAMLASGDYVLQAVSDKGCTASSPVINVPQAAFAAIGATSVAIRDDYCSKKTGLIDVKSFNKPVTGYQFTWIDSASQQVIGTGTKLESLSKGTYYLQGTDINGCEGRITTSRIKEIPAPVITENGRLVTADICNQSIGSIKNIKITGLLGNTVYTWKNDAGQTVGNSLDLLQVRSGSYRLLVNDFGMCEVQSGLITIDNSNLVLQAPSYKDLILPRYSTAEMKPLGAIAGNYELYASSDARQPLQQKATGHFSISDIKSDTAFYIRQLIGTCESPLTRVSISVVDKSFFAIPTAFTPNGDGINDMLTVRAVGYVSLKSFSIYNRNGELVFSTTLLGDGWNGSFKGKPQPIGTFVWMAEGKDINGHVIRDKGSFVLIH